MADVESGSIVAILKPDGSTEWWRLTDGWNLVKTDPASSAMATDAEVAAAIAAHAALPNAHHAANNGLTGTRTLGNFSCTFTNGLLTGIQAVKGGV